MCTAALPTVPGGPLGRRPGSGQVRPRARWGRPRRPAILFAGRLGLGTGEDAAHDAFAGGAATARTPPRGQFLAHPLPELVFFFQPPVYEVAELLGEVGAERGVVAVGDEQIALN